MSFSAWNFWNLCSRPSSAHIDQLSAPFIVYVCSEFELKIGYNWMPVFCGGCCCCCFCSILFSMPSSEGTPTKSQTKRKLLLRCALYLHALVFVLSSFSSLLLSYFNSIILRYVHNNNFDFIQHSFFLRLLLSLVGFSLIVGKKYSVNHCYICRCMAFERYSEVVSSSEMQPTTADETDAQTDKHTHTHTL